MAAANVDLVRPVAHFPQTLWNLDELISSYTVDDLDLKSLNKPIEELKVQVRDLLLTPANDPVEKVKLIDSLTRLGISYHFKSDIDEQLSQIFHLYPNLADDSDSDLFTTSLLFRVFRQNGYKISSDVFYKFKDCDGKFDERISYDAKAMLSLYEAAHLRLHGEDILDEAVVYTSNHLKSIATQCSPHLSKHIALALLRPFYHSIPRIESRQYIDFCEKEESQNEMLLKFAKIDFNRVQLLHQQELSQILRWYNDLELASKFPYARHRTVELYFWAAGAYFEPQYSQGRIILSKILNMISILDDTYDAYGTIDELRRFTKAMERWDVDALDDLPSYMKTLYGLILQLYDEIEIELESEGRSDGIPYAKNGLKQLVRVYLVEAEWCNKNYVPSFDEYIKIASISTCYHVISISSFLGMKEATGVKAFEWMETFPAIDRASHVICRLMDDIVSIEHEKKRGHVATGIECYVKQHGVSEGEAIEHFHKLIANGWKDVHGDCMRPTPVSLDIMTRIINLVGVVMFIYQYNDGYTFSEILKDSIKSLFFERIPV